MLSKLVKRLLGVPATYTCTLARKLLGVPATCTLARKLLGVPATCTCTLARKLLGVSATCTLARKLLGVPAKLALIERDFSHGSNILKTERDHALSEIFDDLLCLKFNSSKF